MLTLGRFNARLQPPGFVELERIHQHVVSRPQCFEPGREGGNLPQYRGDTIRLSGLVHWLHTIA